VLQYFFSHLESSLIYLLLFWEPLEMLLHIKLQRWLKQLLKTHSTSVFVNQEFFIGAEAAVPISGDESQKTEEAWSNIAAATCFHVVPFQPPSTPQQACAVTTSASGGSPQRWRGGGGTCSSGGRRGLRWHRCHCVPEPPYAQHHRHKTLPRSGRIHHKFRLDLPPTSDLRCGEEGDVG
jgi:hypothetical protein